MITCSRTRGEHSFRNGPRGGLLGWQILHQQFFANGKTTMSNSDREAQEQRNNPVGQRPQDIRSRTDVIMERDAHHLDNQQGETASVQGLSPEPDETMRTGKERRMEKGASPTLDADGKPYGHDEDPDSTGTKAGTLGGIGGLP